MSEPNPHKDKVPLFRRLSEWASHTSDPLSTWVLVVGLAMLTVAFLLWLIAILVGAADTNSRIGQMALLFSIVGSAISLVGGVMKA